MDEVCGRVEPSEAGDRWGGARGRGAEPRGLEEEERDGREEQENRPPPRHQPHRSLPQATRCGLPSYSARSPCRCRRSTVVVGDRDGDASDRRRRHREGSGGEMVAVVGLPLADGWARGLGRESPTKAGPYTTLRHFGGPRATAAQKSRTAPQSATFVGTSCFSRLPPRSHAVRHVQPTSSIRVTPSHSRRLPSRVLKNAPELTHPMS